MSNPSPGVRVMITGRPRASASSTSVIPTGPAYACVRGTAKTDAHGHADFGRRYEPMSKPKTPALAATESSVVT